MGKLLLGLPMLGIFSLSLNAKRLCETHYYIVEPVKLMPVLLKYKEIKFIKKKIIPLNRAIDRLSKKVREEERRKGEKLEKYFSS